MRSSESGKWSCAWKSIGVLCASLLLVCLPAFSQQLNLGSISGIVTAQAGGALAGATVTVIDEARGVERPLTTTSAGEYAAPSLTPGLYTVRVTATGYKTYEHTAITVGVGQDVRLDIVMQPGAETETVSVTGDVSAVSTANSAVAHSESAAELNETPNNGGNYGNNLENRPGFLNLPGGGANSRFSNGQRSDANVWLIDGVYDGDINVGFSIVNGFSVSAGPNPTNMLPLDAIQETTLITNPEAEFGYKPGQVINSGIKSGTNAFHGAAFALGRDEGMDARNPFSPSTPVPGLNPLSAQGKEPYGMSEWGGDVGGPIKKDKLFFFGDFQEIAYDVGDQSVEQAPTTQDIGSTTFSIPDAIYDIYHNAANTTGIPVSQLSLNLAGCGTSPGGGGLTPATAATATLATLVADCHATAGVFGNASSSASESLDFLSPGHDWTQLEKIDYHIDQHNALNLEFLDSRGASNAWASYRSVEPWWTTDATEGAQIGRTVWIWTPNATNLNEARVGFDRINAQAVNSECQAGSEYPGNASFGFDPGTLINCAFPYTSISSLTALNVTNGKGPVKNLSWDTTGVDNFSHTVGKHQFRFGVEIHSIGYNGTGLGGTGEQTVGQLSFGTPAAWAKSGTNPAATGLESFLVGDIGSSLIQEGNFIRNVGMNWYGVYAQDEYRLSARVAVSLGLRYEYSPAYHEKNNLFGNICFTCLSGMNQQTDNSPIYKQSEADNFGPRLGIAYDLTGKGTTVVRASFDILYSTQTYSSFSASGTVPTAGEMFEPNGYQLYSNGSTGLPNGTPTCCTTGPGTINNVQYAPPTGSVPWAVNTPVFGAFSGLTTPQCGNGQLASLAGGGAGAGVTAGYINPPPCATFAINPYLRVPYVPQWDLDFGHAFGKALTLTIAYVGNHGVELRSYYDMNMPTPGAKTPSGAAKGSLAASTEQDRRPLTAECPTSVPGGTGVAGIYGNDCFPWFGQIIQVGNLDSSIYDGLQMALTSRAYHGLTFNASYTYSHTIAQLSSAENGAAATTLMDFFNPAVDLGSIGTPEHMTLTASYQIPGKRVLGNSQLLQGWVLNGGLLINGKSPAAVTDTADDFSGTGEKVDRWTMGTFNSSTGGVVLGAGGHAIEYGGLTPVPCYGVSGSSFGVASTGCAIVSSVSAMPAACLAVAEAEPGGTSNGSLATGMTNLGTAGCYLQNGTAIVPPAQGTYGLMQPGALYGPTFRQLDMSLFKSFVVKERLTAQFRVECFNIFNRTQYSGSGSSLNTPSTFGVPTTTANNASAGIVIGNGSPREIQLGLRFTF